MKPSFEKPSSEEPDTPQFETVGGADEEQKKQLKEEKKKLLENNHENLGAENLELVEKFEEEKTKEELALINTANKEVDKLMEKAGGDSYDLPPENYHLVSDEFYEESNVKRSKGAYNSSRQVIILNKDYVRENKVLFLKTALHETFHAKGKFVSEIEGEGEMTTTTPYRRGIEMLSSQKDISEGNYHRHFTGIHEALADKVAKRTVQQVIENHPDFEQEKKHLNSDVARAAKKVISRRPDLPEDDIFWVSEDGTPYFIGSEKPREVLDYVCEEVSKELPDEYEDREEVFEEFLKGHFSGEVLDLARAVEKTFGKGSFRTLGNMKPDETSAEQQLEKLKKKRNEVLKEKE